MNIKEVIIVAPHADDEVIGCFEVLTAEIAEVQPIILYTEEMPNERKEETLKLKEHVKIKAQLFLKSVPNQFLNKETLLYFPDPSVEIHPAHRLQGTVGESYARNGLNVNFYNTTMTAPYIHEVRNPDKKKEILDTVYPSQSGLWKYEHKYFLFEGYTKWLF